MLTETHDALMICNGNETAVTGTNALESWHGTVVEQGHDLVPQGSLQPQESGWGDRTGTEDDKETLGFIIASELKKTENLSTSKYA